MEERSLYIVLGCFGRTDDGFISCASVKNPILEVSPSIHGYEGLMDYLDNCNLFDRTILDYNTIRHLIHNIFNKFDQPTRKLWSEKQFCLYQKFVIDHKDCGLFLRLEFSNDCRDL